MCHFPWSYHASTQVGYPATCLQVDIDQTLLVQGKTNSAREKPEGAASRAPKRRKTRRSTAGIRIRAVVGDEGDGNSGGRISSDKMDTPAGQGSAAERQREAQVCFRDDWHHTREARSFL